MKPYFLRFPPLLILLSPSLKTNFLLFRQAFPLGSFYPVILLFPHYFWPKYGARDLQLVSVTISMLILGDTFSSGSNFNFAILLLLILLYKTSTLYSASLLHSETMYLAFPQIHSSLLDTHVPQIQHSPLRLWAGYRSTPCSLPTLGLPQLPERFSLITSILA